MELIKVMTGQVQLSVLREGEEWGGVLHVTRANMIVEMILRIKF